MSNPFILPEPCILGCSGGRTSGFLVRKVLDAYDNRLPSTVHIVFANTGKEDEMTLKFVERISIEWSIEITWLEYVNAYPKHDFRVVNYATASRNGEPFDDMLKWKARYRREVKKLPPVLPNPAQRMCTGDLKMKTIARFARRLWNLKRPSEFSAALALRADEPRRIDSARKRDNEGGVAYFPLDVAEIVAADVLEFWKGQSFDLGIKSYQGNCDLCFMKNRESMDRLLRENPGRAEWWAQKEKESGQRFRNDRPGYAGMLWTSQHQKLIPFPDAPEIESVITCEGGYCSD